MGEQKDGVEEVEQVEEDQVEHVGQVGQVEQVGEYRLTVVACRLPVHSIATEIIYYFSETLFSSRRLHEWRFASTPPPAPGAMCAGGGRGKEVGYINRVVMGRVRWGMCLVVQRTLQLIRILARIR